jgi:hypothetical protein
MTDEKARREAEVAIALLEARLREHLQLSRSHREWLCDHIRAIRAEVSQGGMPAARRQLLEEMEENSLTILAMRAQGERLLVAVLAADQDEDNKEDGEAASA